MTAPALTLASTSRYRRALLDRLELPYATVDPGVDERRIGGESGTDLVRRLSRAKAAACTGPDNVCIGSDQCAELEGELLGKPGSGAAAVAQLQRCAGRTVLFLTGVCVASANRSEVQVDVTRVRFRRLEVAEIERYVAREQPLDCAGSFKMEGLGISLFESIDTADPTALQGLPLIAVCRLLRQFGFRLP